MDRAFRNGKPSIFPQFNLKPSEVVLEKNARSRGVVELVIKMKAAHNKRLQRTRLTTAVVKSEPKVEWNRSPLKRSLPPAVVGVWVLI